MNTPLRIVYFGTAPFAEPPLQALLEDPTRFSVIAVVSQPDKPVGRKGEITASPVTLLARARGVALLQPKTLKDDAIFSSLEAYKADVYIVAAYGKIIPKRLLDLPRIAPLNLHGSLLPKYRGASPIQTAILEGEKTTGVSLMVMDEEVDHGPVIATTSVTIIDEDTHETLEATLGDAAAGLLTDYLELFANGDVEAKPQDHTQATFTKILEREDGLILWSKKDAAKICRQIRAYDPWPGAYFIWKNKGTDMRVKIIAAEPVEATLAPGTSFVLADDTPAVATVAGGVALIEVQPEGKKPMPGKAFVNGYKNFVGSVLS